ncbi:MAG: hypothetical protein KBD15_01360 [Candidatus Magasanikbacteria bacterium]|nr:hypothetical protein [Candidatus Magasanikbacteria bacterium]
MLSNPRFTDLGWPPEYHHGIFSFIRTPNWVDAVSEMLRLSEGQSGEVTIHCLPKGVEFARMLIMRGSRISFRGVGQGNLPQFMRKDGPDHAIVKFPDLCMVVSGDVYVKQKWALVLPPSDASLTELADSFAASGNTEKATRVRRLISWVKTLPIAPSVHPDDPLPPEEPPKAKQTEEERRAQQAKKEQEEYYEWLRNQ